MNGKVALEEHFAVSETLGDSEEYFPEGQWAAKRRQLLDLLDERLERMDACGIEYSIISLNAPAIQAITDPENAVRVARIANDELAAQVAKRSDRLGAFAAIPMQDPEVAVTELRRTVNEMGFLGALVNGFSQIDTADNAVYCDDSRYDPFWSAMADLDVPFYLHPRNPLDSQQLMYTGQPWLLGPAWGFAVETGAHALRLIGSGLFDRHPDLQIILGHLGEGVAHYIWRTSHWASADGKNPQGVKAQGRFIDYFRRNFYLTTSGAFRTIAMRNAIEEIGIDRVLFSTDYPFEEMEEAASWFDNAEINDTDRDKIGRLNAKSLFKLT